VQSHGDFTTSTALCPRVRSFDDFAQALLIEREKVDAFSELWYAFPSVSALQHRVVLFVFSLTGGTAIAKASDYRINEAIRAPEVRLVGPNGENIGVVSRAEALRVAREANLDLVEVAPNAKPPVCRVMDFGKFLYERAKKERQARKSQAKVEIKELRLRPKTSEHHREFKVRSARKWLEKGMKDGIFSTISEITQVSPKEG